MKGPSHLAMVNPSGDELTAVVSTLLNAKAVCLEGASLTPKQVHAFCDHVELLIRALVYDAQTFTLLTDPQSIMAIGVRFMTLRKVVQFIQVDVDDHHGRPGQHRTDPQAVL